MSSGPSTGTPPSEYDELWTEVYGDMQEMGPVHRHMRRIVGDLLSTIEYRTALDVGCGAGENLPLLYAGGATEVWGVDVSGEALGRARRRLPVELHELDIQRGRVDQRFDLVFSSLVLEHLPDDIAALRNMREMTAGHLLVTTIAGDFERYRPWDEQMGHVRNYRRGELERKVAAAGFTVQRAVYWGFPFYSPLVRRLQNLMRAEPTYGTGTRLLARLLYLLYHLNSSRRGDLLVVLASV